MTEFTINKSDLKKFFDVCCMEGTIQFRDKKGIKKPLFSTFYLNVKNNVLEVLTTDPYRRKTDAQFIKRDVITLAEGTIPILEIEAIMSCLKGKGISGLISVSNKDSIITLETSKDVYEIRQKGKIFLDELKDKDKAQVLKHLDQWKTWHEFEKVQGVKEDELNAVTIEYEQLFMNHPTVKVPYPMRIKIKKEELLKVVGDTLNIMKDNKTRLCFKNGVFKVYKGEENAKIKSKHEIAFEYLLPEEECIEFDEEFYNVQSIMPNLFDEIEFNIRRVNENKTIAIFVRSIDDKSKIEANVGLISIIKGGEEEKTS